MDSRVRRSRLFCRSRLLLCARRMPSDRGSTVRRPMIPALALLLGLAVGALAAWALVRSRYAAELERELAAAGLATSNRSFLDLARSQLEQLQQRTTQELEQRKQAVEHLVAPIRESL